MLFPMYTVAVDVVLKMKQVRPHEHLKAGRFPSSFPLDPFFSSSYSFEKFR